MTITDLSGMPVSGTIPKPTYMLKSLSAAYLSKALLLTPADEVVPRCYIRHLYFYCNKNLSQPFMTVDKLVKALHQTLELYPIVYGRVFSRPDGKLEIRKTNGDGVPVYITQVSYGFEVFGPDWPHSRTPLGLEPIGEILPDETSPSLLIRITYLRDNQGVIIGVAGRHSVMDGNSIETLLQTWAAITRGAQPELPCLDRHLIHATGPPSHNHPEFRWFEQEMHPPNDFGPLVLFNITGDQLSTLKAEASLTLGGNNTNFSTHCSNDSSLNNDVPWISTNDALCALIWRASIRARRLNLKQITNLSIPINARSRLNPPIPNNYFGNGSLGYEAWDQVENLISKPLGYVARLLRKQQQETANAEFLQSAINFLADLPDENRIQHPFAVLTGIDFLITNLTSFDFYDIDFGYGPAMQFRLPSDLLSVCAYIIRAPPSNSKKIAQNGNGVQVFIGLDTDSMNRLCKDPEFCRYANFVG
ncbi:transferase [Syncephalis fuscata]|nr:transferase [Syncephalis fuscata]